MTNLQNAEISVGQYSQMNDTHVTDDSDALCAARLPTIGAEAEDLAASVSSITLDQMHQLDLDAVLDYEISHWVDYGIQYLSHSVDKYRKKVLLCRDELNDISAAQRNGHLIDEDKKTSLEKDLRIQTEQHKTYERQYNAIVRIWPGALAEARTLVSRAKLVEVKRTKRNKLDSNLFDLFTMKKLYTIYGKEYMATSTLRVLAFGKPNALAYEYARKRPCVYYESLHLAKQSFLRHQNDVLIEKHKNERVSEVQQCDLPVNDASGNITNIGFLHTQELAYIESENYTDIVDVNSKTVAMFKEATKNNIIYVISEQFTFKKNIGDPEQTLERLRIQFLAKDIQDWEILEAYNEDCFCTLDVLIARELNKETKLLTVA